MSEPQRVWVRASDWAKDRFHCDAHTSNSKPCLRKVAWIIALADGTGPELGVCHQHRGATRAFVLTEYGP